jgi:serine/threonine-protein kinase ULK/ATG1
MTEKEGNLKHVDQFVFTKVLGKGSSVTVYQANDQIRKNIVAIKEISFAIIKDVNSFKRECIILKKLKHENIIKLIGIENTKKNCHLICDYCNGGNLLEYKRFYQTYYSTQLNELYVQKIIRQVIKGLEYLHLNGMIHRDIKLDNILLNFNSIPNVLGEKKQCQVIDLKKMSLNDNVTIKIGDLGLAKELKLTKAGTICGIPITASNDKNINNNKTYNTKVDLWSLGSITYELLVGREPYHVQELQELKEEINKAASSLPKSLQLSIEAISFINGLLQFSPEKRMTWDEIKSHPFIVKHPKHFHIINLSNLGVHTDNNLELRIKSCDNYLWLNFLNGSFDLELDKINNEIMDNEETMRIINEKKTVNEELQKAIQNDNNSNDEDIYNAQIEQSVFKMKMETEQKLKQVEEMKKTAEEEKRLMYEESVRIKENILKEIEELKLKQQQEFQHI